MLTVARKTISRIHAHRKNKRRDMKPSLRRGGTAEFWEVFSSGGMVVKVFRQSIRLSGRATIGPSLGRRVMFEL